MNLTDIFIAAIAAYIGWRQESIEKTLWRLDKRLDNLERTLPRRKGDIE